MYVTHNDNLEAASFSNINDSDWLWPYVVRQEAS